MTITYPRDLLEDFPGQSTRFELAYLQEANPTRGGIQASADLGPALWEADYQTKLLKPSELRIWKARLASLENGARTFNGYDKTACFPIAYPNGSWPTGLSFSGIGTLSAVETATYRRLRLASLPEGYTVSEGDYVSYEHSNGTRSLHQALEAAVALDTGITPYFEVRPTIRLGYTLTADVKLIKPHAIMVLIPGSVSAPSSTDGRGTISFSARQTISAS